MNSKTKAFFVITMVTILSVSLITAGGIQPAVADKDDDDHDDKKKLKFKKKPSFVSESCIITSFAEEHLPSKNYEELDCKMTAWLDKKGNALKYKIQVSGMELVDSNTEHHSDDAPHVIDGALDDIDGIHIHHITNDDVTNPKGPHQLNTFGNPGFDDSDVIVKPVQGIVKGIWTDADENMTYGEPNNSHTLTENLGLLCDGKVFSAVHGEFADRPGHKAPYVKMVLEPTKQGNKICNKLGY